MFRVPWFLVYLLILLKFFAQGYGERTKDKMYEKIAANTACYRRLNATHQTGCSSKRGGSTGVVHYCDTLNDLTFILSNGSASPYIPILPTKYMNQNVLQQLIISQKISGLILHSNNESLNYYTHEYQCPNPVSSLPGTCTKNNIWNPHGTGLLYADIPFPIFYVEDGEEILKIKECFEKFNNYSYDSQSDRSLCSLELRSFMYATTDTPTCRRRSDIVSNLNPVKFCDPLGDNNIWASLYPLVKGFSWNETLPITDHKYIVIAAKIDTTSMFEKTSGANSPVSGIVTLLAVAKYLKEILTVKDIEEAKTNILFIYFNGETYDYLGSQRMLYDMLRGDFPLKHSDGNNILPVIHPENISLFIELSQLGNNKEELFVHYLNDSLEVNDFYEKLQGNSKSVKFTNVSSSVPPASLHTFLKYDSYFRGLVISDHKSNYTNHFYNSIFDDASNIDFNYKNTTDNEYFSEDSIQTFTANVAETLGKTVYEIYKMHKYNGTMTVDVGLVNELFFCYLKDPNCKVHKATQKGTIWPKIPLNLYVGVDHIVRYATTLTALTLGWVTGDIYGEGNENCTNTPRNYAYKYYNMSKSIYDLNVTLCYKITMNKTEALSPAFIIPDYDWSSGKYSTWTESRWLEVSVRMFLKPSSAHENMTIAIGSISMIFSFILVYFIKSRSHILFTPPLLNDAPTDC